MPHEYNRIAIRPDGSQHVERVAISDDRLLVEIGRVDRLGLLELVNRWNKAQAFVPGNNIYIYSAE